MTTVTTEVAPVVEPKTREQLWHDFLVSLKPWQLHKLFALDELTLHDEFIAGKKELVDVFLLICVEGDDNPYEKKKKPKETQ